VGGVRVPEPLVTVKVTVTLLTALPLTSVTRTLGGTATAVLTLAGCVMTEIAVIVVAGPAVKANDPDVTFDSPVALNRSVYGPAIPVSTRFVNVATPFTAFTGVVPVNRPVPENTAAVTAAVLVVWFPFASRTTITGWVVNATVFCAPPGCVVIASCVAAPAVPVALKVTGLPVSPAAVAVTVFAPATVPSVQLVSVAMPLAFVTTVVGGAMIPPPAVTANVTLTPDTGTAPALVTNTLGGAATPVPAVADCVTAEFAAMVGATVKLADVALLRPVAVKRNVCGPLLVSTRFVNVATPFTAFTIAVPLNTPVPVNTAAVTAAVLVVWLPFASRMAITGCVVNAAPLAAPFGCVVIASCVAAPAVPVALKLIGLPVRPATVAVTVFAPAAVPSVQLASVAMPLAFVITIDGGAIVPPPDVMANVTLTPDTGTAPAPVTNTLGGAATTVPAVADWVTTEFAAMVVAATDTVKLADVVLVRPVAVKRNVCAPLPVRTRFANVATPFTAFTMAVPLNTPVPENTEAVTTAVLEVVFPFAS